MLRRTLFFCLFTSYVALAWGQEIPPENQLPGWAQEKWRAISKSRSFEISTRINPFVWRGDFDGDNLPDLALFVSSTSTQKEGIVILFQGKRPTLVLGAGTSFGN
jgi:hypothetical protein